MDLYEARDYHLRHVAATRRLKPGQEATSHPTYRGYAAVEKRFLEFLESQGVGCGLDRLNPVMVDDFVLWLRAQIATTGRPASRNGAVACRQYVSILKIWASFLRKRRLYPHNPLAEVEAPKAPKIHREPFSQEEAFRVVAVASTGRNAVRNRALVLFFLDTGARVGEVCATELRDLDLLRGSVIFRNTKNGQPREVIFGVKSHGDGGPCVRALKAWLAVRNAREGVDVLFTKEDGEPFDERRVREAFARWGRAAGVLDCFPHRCRHTHATEFLTERPGAEIQLRQRLGHLSHDVLADYVSYGRGAVENAAEVASLSSKWGLEAARPKPAELPPAPAAPPTTLEAALIEVFSAMLRSNPNVSARLLESLGAGALGNVS